MAAVFSAMTLEAEAGLYAQNIQVQFVACSRQIVHFACASKCSATMCTTPPCPWQREGHVCCGQVQIVKRFMCLKYLL